MDDQHQQHQQSGSNSDTIAKAIAEAEQIAQQNRMVDLAKQMAQRLLDAPGLSDEHRMAIQGLLNFTTWQETDAGAGAADYLRRPENATVIADTAASIIRLMGLPYTVLIPMLPLAEHLVQLGYWMRDRRE